MKNFGKSFFTVVLLSATTAIPTALAAPIIIDPFTSSQAAIISPGSPGLNPYNVTNSTANNAPFALGGQREFIARRTVGSGKIELDVNDTAFESLSFSSSGDAAGRGLVVWDGPDTTVGAFDPTSADPAIQRGQPDAFGLTGTGPTGGVDLTANGSNNAVLISAFADNVGLPLIFYFYRSATAYATASLNIPGNTGTFDLVDYNIPFSTFAATGLLAGETVLDIFKDTKAITLQIDGRNASDAHLDNFMAAQLPEPGSLALLVSGIGLFAAFQSRRYSRALGCAEERTASIA